MLFLTHVIFAYQITQILHVILCKYYNKYYMCNILRMKLQTYQIQFDVCSQQCRLATSWVMNLKEIGERR